MKIERVELYRLKIPLKQPYIIATAAMKAFDCTIVHLRTEDRVGLGEAMAGIQGYFWETPEEVWGFAKENGPKILNLPIPEASEHISSFVPKQPCAATPFLTALEMLSRSTYLLPPKEMKEVSLVGILQAHGHEEIRREIGEFLAQGYDTFKIKVGFDAEEDIRRVKVAQEEIQGRALIRLDANQGYTFPRAQKLVQNVDPQGIEFLEQPFKENEWEAMAELAKISPFPLGLDESIYGIEAVEKTLRLNCARFVKFKIMKMGSAEVLAQAIELAKKSGLEVILGNGAAGEISCYHEALVSARTMTRAGEMNGFLKQKESVLLDGLTTRNGKILLNPEFWLQLDPEKVERFALERLTFG